MIRGYITVTGGPGVCAKQFKRIRQEAFMEAVEMWHSDIMPLHFEEGAGNRYKYQQRSTRHMVRKWKKFHHRRPLVFSGDMEREVKRMIRVKPTQNGAQGDLFGPKYLWAYRKDYKQPDKAAELVRVIHSEEKQLADLINAIMTEKLNGLKDTERVAA